VAAPAPAPAPTARPAAAPPAAPAAPAHQPAPAPVAIQAGDAWQALTPMRRAIADHMVRSVSTAPHVSMCIEIDVTGVAKRRTAAQAEFKARESFELTYLPFMAKAVIEAVREHPILNARFQAREDGQQGLLLHGQLNLGIAVGLDAGLVVPVIRNADSLSIAGLARAVRDLATRARSSKLALEDLKGGTFTLNNTGAFGSISSNPIINDGQAGIITMEAVVRRPVVVNRDGEEAIVVRSMMNSCLTFDHRVLDGLQAGRFLQSVKRRLEAVGPDTPLY
jgi:2-oxoisovalerate dehydrogenase E2 component (dihydrolipoyl transacylase)